MTWTMLVVRFCVRWDVAEPREEAECVWYGLERRPEVRRWLRITKGMQSELEIGHIHTRTQDISW